MIGPSIQGPVHDYVSACRPERQNRKGGTQKRGRSAWTTGQSTGVRKEIQNKFKLNERGRTTKQNKSKQAIRGRLGFITNYIVPADVLLGAYKRLGYHFCIMILGSLLFARPSRSSKVISGILPGNLPQIRSSMQCRKGWIRRVAPSPSPD